MNAIVTTITPDTTPDTFLVDAVAGAVKFHTERSNGTFRRVHFLPADSTERQTAEWVVLQREEGKTMKAIAAEMHVSVPTVRRMINDLLLTQEMEDSDSEEIADLIEGGYVEETVEASA